MAILANHNSEIVQQLIKAFNLPKRTVGFTIKVRLAEVVSVECEFYPEATSEKIEFKEYVLSEKKT